MKEGRMVGPAVGWGGGRWIFRDGRVISFVPPQSPRATSPRRIARQMEGFFGLRMNWMDEPGEDDDGDGLNQGIWMGQSDGMKEAQSNQWDRGGGVNFKSEKASRAALAQSAA